MGGQHLCLLNVGASITNYVVLFNGEVVFCRDIPTGGNAYTAEIQKTMGMSFEEAEGMKINMEAGGAPEELNETVQGGHEILCDEIAGSTEFFLNTNQAQELAAVYITGGGSKTPGLVEALARSYRVERLDPFIRVMPDSSFSLDYIEQIRDFAAIAVGLGMRTAGDT
jgi:type IV pilus assembly protein PilM